MGLARNILNSLARNAKQQNDGFTGYGYSAHLNNYNGYETDVYTRDYMGSFFDGLNRGGEFDNLYGDYNRIISNAPTFPLFYVDKNGDIDTESTVAQYLDKPNEDYPQYKVLQQIYSEMVTRGYAEIFLWRKDGRNETKIFDPNKKYREDDFRGFTLVAGYNKARLTRLERGNIIRIHLGASQENVFMGHSPTQAARAWRKMQDEMGLHMTAFARNAGMPIGKWIITAPNVETYKEIKDKLQKETAGARNNGKQLYSYRPSESKNAQIEWVQFTSQDVQDYTPQLEFSEKKMSQSFGVPGTIKGTNDDASYATARVSEQVFIKYTIKPLVDDLREQLSFEIEKRFDISGEIKTNIVIPEIADESKVKIEATKLQVELFDQKRAEGYTAESIVAAYNLPESFLLLETTTDAEIRQNAAKRSKKGLKTQDKPENKLDHVNKNELLRQYQNALTKEERERLENEFRTVTTEYADEVLKNGVIEAKREEYTGDMSVVFSAQYATLYDKAVQSVVDALLETLDSVDITDLELTDEELEEAVKQYKTRVDDFSKTFSADVAKLPGETLEVRRASAQYNIDRVVVTESEHTRVVSELKAWTKSEEEFPVRVTKKWNALPDACPECLALEDTEIDVTALFIHNPNIKEVYEVTAGGLHPNCRCFCTYVMNSDEVRRFEGEE